MSVIEVRGLTKRFGPRLEAANGLDPLFCASAARTTVARDAG
jgi:hypothetical protein